jgi:hypothetical protein
MLKFKEFLGEAVLDYYHGKKLIGTSHLLKRQKERDVSDHELRHIFRKATDHLQDNDYGDQDKFLFYSKKFDRAVAFSHQQNTRDKADERKHLVATTVLPKGESYANRATQKVTVEGYSPEFISYVNSFIGEEARVAEPLSTVIVEDIEFYFLHGKLDNLPFVEFIEIE